MALSESQKRFLRGRGHGLRPIIHVGNAGFTPAVMAELDAALTHHELLKVKVRAGDREDRDSAIATLVQQTGADLLSRVGHIALLYRRNPANPRIVLPNAPPA
jgi:RNA-binding protein